MDRQAAAAVCAAVAPSAASRAAASAHPAGVRGTFSTQLSLPPRTSISANAETPAQTQPLPIPSQVAGAEDIPLPVTPREAEELGGADCRPAGPEPTDSEVVNQLQKLTVRSEEPEVRGRYSSSRKGEPRRQENKDFGRMPAPLSPPPPSARPPRRVSAGHGAAAASAAAAAGPRAAPSAPPRPPFNPSRLSKPKPSAPAIDAEPPVIAAADEGERHWRGVIKNAVVEGTMIQAFPAVIQKGWEAFHWKVLEKLRTAVSQYGIRLLIKPVRNPRSSVLIVVNLDTSRANVEFLLTKRRCNSCKKDNHTTKNAGRRETLRRAPRPLARRHKCKGFGLPALSQPRNCQIRHCRKLRSGRGNRSRHYVGGCRSPLGGQQHKGTMGVWA